MKLPSQPFTWSSSSLGLLLVFRTNTAFKRWDEGRKAWGQIINSSRTAVRLGTQWSDQEADGSKEKLKRVELKIRESSTQPGRLTAENSTERREALAKARSAGVHFKVTGGDHLTWDDMLIGYELVKREEQISKLESRKKDALGASRRNEYGQEVINRLREERQVDAIMIDDPSPITNKDLDILLKWKLDSETLPGAVTRNKTTRVAKWIEIRNAAANDDDEPQAQPDWTEENEAELRNIKNEELTLKNTAAGREKQKGVNDAFAMIVAASPTTKQALLARLSGVPEE
jgi:hypothetical protein